MRALSTLWLCTFGLVVSNAFAQTAATSPTSPASAETPSTATSAVATPVVASDPAATSLSTKSAPAVAATHPLTNPSLSGFTFEAPAAEKKRMELQAQAAIEEEDEKPRNGIIRLPKYEIQGDRPPVFSDSAINTGKTKGELAVKKYLSPAQQVLNKLALPSWLGGMSNEAVALELAAEDERLSTMSDLNDKASLFQAAGDKESADSMKSDAQEMYMRPRDPAQPGYLRQSADQIPSTNLNR